MDIHLLDAAPTERRARGGRARARAAGRRLGRRRARLRPPGPLAARRRATRRARAGTCCCRCCWPCRSTSGWISPGALNHIAERLTVPPADVYGVATFYALLSVEPRPPRVVHVCEDLACRCNGSQELIAQLEEHLGRRGRAQRRRLGDLAAQPVPRPVRPRAGRDADARGRAPRGARARARRCERGARGDRRPRGREHRSRHAAAAERGGLPAAARARRARRSRRASTTTARRAATRRCGARSSSAARA